MTAISNNSRSRYRSRTSTNNSATVLSSPLLVAVLTGFVFGCIVCTTVLLSLKIDQSSSDYVSGNNVILHQRQSSAVAGEAQERVQGQEQETAIPREDRPNNAASSILSGVKILIAIAAYDFNQLPHLEEVLDAYFDLCASGSHVDMVIHTTIPYPITLIDLLNTRLTCTNPVASFQVKIEVHSPGLRLHLVDLHRTLFYDHIDDYDLFIYTEDDIRVSPRTVASYLYETQLLQQEVGFQESLNYNVGIVRYEYNFPSNVLMDDKTRQATQNVTRVYWEHSYESPAIPKVVDRVKHLKSDYVHMKNHHQGMFLATRDLLLAWKQLPTCQFHIVTDRPGGHSQPKEGTQRVWMSSQQLYAPKHCGIQQVIPVDRFGALTVLHLPNKNYRRVGHFRNRTFSDGSETFDMGSPLLLTALALHLEMRQQVTMGQPQSPYRGITMVDHVDRKQRWGPELRRKFARDEYYRMLDQRMKDYDMYVERGGVLSPEDFSKTTLVDAAPVAKPTTKETETR